MKSKLFIVAASLLVLSACGLKSPRSVSVSSPDGNLGLNLVLLEDGPAISIDYKGKRIVEPSSIGFEWEDGTVDGRVRISKGKTSRIVDDYDMPVGKTSHVHSISNQRTVTLTEPDGKRVHLFLRAFDDGVAFRYVIPQQAGMDTLRIKGERFGIRPSGDPVVKAMYHSGFRNSHENVYVTKPLSQHAETGKLADMPVLLRYEDGCHLAVTEAMG